MKRVYTTLSCLLVLITSGIVAASEPAQVEPRSPSDVKVKVVERKAEKPSKEAKPEKPAATEKEKPAANPYTEMFADEEFQSELDQVLEPIRTDVAANREKVEATATELSELKSDLPGIIANQTAKLVPGLVSAELTQQLPGQLKSEVAEAITGERKNLAKAVKDEVIPAFVRQLEAKEKIAKKASEPEAQDSEETAPKKSSPSVAKKESTKPQQRYVDPNHSYPRCVAPGRRSYMPEPVEGFGVCKHCGANSNQICGSNGPVDCASLRRGKSSGKESRQLTVSTKPQSSSSTLDIVQLEEEPATCKPGQPCYQQPQQAQPQYQQPQYRQPQYRQPQYRQQRSGLFGGLFK